MARVKTAKITRKKHKKILKLAKGYYGAKGYRFRMAKQAVMKSGNYAYVGRKAKKRDFRKLWIARISAAVKAEGMNYSSFMHALKLSKIQLDRKTLSNMAIEDKAAFKALCDTAKKALAK